MSKNKNMFLETRYRQEADQWDKYITSDGIASHAESWLRTDTVDCWRHSRMYACLDPVLSSYPEATWLTVGDGRYGRDAHYIQAHGCEVTASDISESLLRAGFERKYIDRYSVENAEGLSFEDDTFDFVFSKECLHHLPRPWIGLYEMLRVAREGIIIVEPAETPLVQKPRSIIKALIMYYINKYIPWAGKWLSPREIIRAYGNNWEEVGNYLFRFSEREIEKVSIALDYGLCAFKYLNDAYTKGVEQAPLDSPMFQQIKRRIAKKDRLCALGLNQGSYSFIACAIFKVAPSEAVLETLRQAGYRIKMLPHNPYRQQ